MPSKAESSETQNAIELLTQDHKNVQQLFKSFEKLKDSDNASDEQKAEIVGQACAALMIHAQIEEEIFYPAARDAIDDQDLLDEAEVEHASAKELIAQLADMQPDGEFYDAKFTVLGEYVNHHIKEEQDELFPKVKKAKVDLDSLGLQLRQRAQELMAEMGFPSKSDDEESIPASAAVAKRQASDSGRGSMKRSAS